MLHIYDSENGRLVEAVAAEAAAGEGARHCWIDLLRPTGDEKRKVEGLVGLEIPSAEEMQEIETSSRLYAENGATFMTVSAVTGLETDEPRLAPITFILKGATLITVRHVEPKPITAALGRLQRSGGVSDGIGESVMLALTEALVDRMADTLERVGTEIDALSRQVFGHKNRKPTKSRDFQGILNQIGREGDLQTLVRESLVTFARMLAYYAALGGPDRKLPRDLRLRTKTLQRDVRSLSDHASFLSGKINFMLDATLGLINLEQNQIIKIFSVASVVFLPPTLVASIYGMNVPMPEASWRFGYPFALALMLLSAVIPFVFAKRKGWL